MGPWATADRKQCESLFHAGLTHSLAENDDTGRPESLHGCICCSEHRSCWISLEQKLHQKGYQEPEFMKMTRMMTRTAMATKMRARKKLDGNWPETRVPTAFSEEITIEDMLISEKTV